MTDSLLDEVRAALKDCAASKAWRGFDKDAADLRALSARLDGMVLVPEKERLLLVRASDIVRLVAFNETPMSVESARKARVWLDNYKAMLAEVGK